MSKFRKKPVVIEAVQVNDIVGVYVGGWDRKLTSWVHDAYLTGKLRVSHNGISVVTPEGTMEGRLDDWLIQGVKGEIYPCKPDIFEETYYIEN